MKGTLTQVGQARGTGDALPEVPVTDNQVGVEMIFLDPAELEGAPGALPPPGPGRDTALRTRRPQG